MPYTEIATITENKEIAENIFQTKMISPNISSEVKPGQFINILPSEHWDKVMRRPMSVAGTESGIISIIYKAVGEGTIVMKNWLEGELYCKICLYFYYTILKNLKTKNMELKSLFCP